MPLPSPRSGSRGRASAAAPTPTYERGELPLAVYARIAAARQGGGVTRTELLTELFGVVRTARQRIRLNSALRHLTEKGLIHAEGPRRAYTFFPSDVPPPAPPPAAGTHEVVFLAPVKSGRTKRFPRGARTD